MRKPPIFERRCCSQNSHSKLPSWPFRINHMLNLPCFRQLVSQASCAARHQPGQCVAVLCLCVCDHWLSLALSLSLSLSLCLSLSLSLSLSLCIICDPKTKKYYDTLKPSEPYSSTAQNVFSRRIMVYYMSCFLSYTIAQTPETLNPRHPHKSRELPKRLLTAT